MNYRVLVQNRDAMNCQYDEINNSAIGTEITYKLLS
jgi:hypothetical protein